jgi:L-iditol 2-dehydrogenase
MNKKQQAAIYYNNHDIRLEEVPVPEIGPGELLVKTIACGLCGGEALEWYHVRTAPKVMGHEPAGVIVAVGEGVQGFREGDRVFVNHHVACMVCHECQRGHYTLCETYRRTKIDPGAMCGYFRVPSANVTKDTLILPDSVSFEDATVCEPWGCVVGGLKATGIQLGDTVAVVGAGFMGAGFMHIAPLFGAAKIFALDLSDWRLQKSLEYGANFTINPNTEHPQDKLRDLNHGRLADAAIVTVPSVKAWELGLQLVGKGGSLHFGAPPPAEQAWTINPEKLYFSEARLSSKYSADHTDTRQVLSWIEARRVRPQLAITHRFALDGIRQAFDLLLQAGESLKSIIYPHGLPEGGSR